MVMVSSLPSGTHLEMGLVMIDRSRWAISVYKMRGLPDHPNYLINIPQVLAVEKECTVDPTVKSIRTGLPNQHPSLLQIYRQSVIELKMIRQKEQFHQN